MSSHHRSLPLYCVIGADALSRACNAMTTITIPLIVLNQGYSAAEVGLSSTAASPDMALYINAVCFLISIAVTLLMVPSDAALWREGVRGTTTPVSDGMSLRDFFAGAAFIVRTPLVRAIVIMVVLTNLLDSAAMNVLWALYARTVSSDGA